MSPTSPTASGVPTQRSVAPNATGADISAATGPHLVFTPSANARTGALLLFLPGTGGHPDQYTIFLRYAATRGLHVVGLAYPNADAVNDLCAGSPTCHEDFRLEVITGEPRSALVDVDKANSIDHRVQALLAYLDQQYPAEGWGAYLSSSDPRWDRVTVAGHSQGGGHAAMIARLRLARRAILFNATEPALWTASAFATPADRLYGFVHRLEAGSTGIKESWRLIGMPGQVVSVDATAAPYVGAHQLETSLTPVNGFATHQAYHQCGVVDAYLPMANGEPLFAPMWAYLLSA
jgi:pimeloyl-ACP methyl ester carboxylesterase